MKIDQLGKFKCRHCGFTLIELMISIAIGMMILAATLSLFVTMVKSNNDNMKSIRLNQDLRSTMSLITRNLRRAGTNQNSAVNSITTPPTNPFQVEGAANNQTIDITNNEAGTADKCITFSYDEDTASGALGVRDNPGELFGFRFDSNDSEVEIRQNGATCAATTDWEAVTDSNLITITDLNFANLTITEAGINIRQITVTLSGELANDDSVSRTLTEIIKIRNDEI